VSKSSHKSQEEIQSVKTFEQDLTKDREEYIIDVLEYTQKSSDDVYRDVYRGETLVRDEWNEKNPQTPEEICKFYRETKNYLFDLGNWHFGNHRRFDVKLLAFCLKSRPKKVLDFGAGMGVGMATGVAIGAAMAEEEAAKKEASAEGQIETLYDPKIKRSRKPAQGRTGKIRRSPRRTEPLRQNQSAKPRGSELPWRHPQPKGPARAGGNRVAPGLARRMHHHHEHQETIPYPVHPWL
jgi:hypothetical protein